MGNIFAATRGGAAHNKGVSVSVGGMLVIDTYLYPTSHKTLLCIKPITQTPATEPGARALAHYCTLLCWVVKCSCALCGPACASLCVSV